MRNVEYKAELRDPGLARAICRRIGATHVVTVEQTDTYYAVASGRLKKREAVVRGDDGDVHEPDEYIHYRRQDGLHPKVSDFEIFDTSTFRERYGIGPVPVWLVVRKTREIWMLGSVRIHVDAVEDLGQFLEFEALVTKAHDEATARRSNEELRATFAPALGEPLACSYSDLLANELETSE